MIKNLVLAGAQLKGVCYIGILKALEELNLLKDIKNVLGISSGSLFGLAICLGFSSESLEHMVLKLNIENLKEFQTDSVFKLFYTYGMDSGDKIEKLIKVILKKKTGNENITFNGLKELFPDKNLIVGGSNLSLARMEYFSAENTPDMCVYKAIRISTSFPFVFEKVDYNDNIYLDGGLIDNYPIEYFQDDIKNTIGISTTSLNSGNKDLSSFDKYMVQIIYVLSSQSERYMANKHKENTVVIKLNYRFDSIDFSYDMKKYLIEEGYKQFKEQILEKDYFIENSDKTDTISQKSIEEDIEVIGAVVKDLMDIVSKGNEQYLDIEEIVNES